MQVKIEPELGRIPILDAAAVVDCARWPAKAVVGETIEVSATVFREGHERLGAAVVLRTPEGGELPQPAHIFTIQRPEAGRENWI